MRPFELVRRGEEEALAYVCVECGAIFNNTSFGMAERCCICVTCGKTLEPGYSRRVGSEHFECSAARIAKEEQALREAHLSLDKIPATVAGAVQGAPVRRVQEKDYFGPVFVDGYKNSESFYESTERLRDTFTQEGWPFPLWVYGCHVTKLSMNAEDVVDHATGDLVEAVRESIDDGDMNCLQDMLDEWVAGVSVPDTWDPDHGLVVVLS